MPNVRSNTTLEEMLGGMRQRQTGHVDNSNAWLYILFVLMFYAFSIVVLMVKYIRREREGSKLDYYYDEFVKRDWYKDKAMYDNQGRKINHEGRSRDITQAIFPPANRLQPTDKLLSSSITAESEESISPIEETIVEEVELRPIPQGPAKLAFCKVDESVRATKCSNRPRSVKVIGCKTNKSIVKEFSSTSDLRDVTTEMVKAAPSEKQ